MLIRLIMSIVAIGINVVYLRINYDKEDELRIFGEYFFTKSFPFS